MNQGLAAKEKKRRYEKSGKKTKEHKTSAVIAGRTETKFVGFFFRFYFPLFFQLVLRDSPVESNTCLKNRRKRVPWYQISFILFRPVITAIRFFCSPDLLGDAVSPFLSVVSPLHEHE